MLYEPKSYRHFKKKIIYKKLVWQQFVQIFWRSKIQMVQVSRAQNSAIGGPFKCVFSEANLIKK
jgi:hypothetical protein